MPSIEAIQETIEDASYILAEKAAGFAAHSLGFTLMMSVAGIMFGAVPLAFLAMWMGEELTSVAQVLNTTRGYAVFRDGGDGEGYGLGPVHWPDTVFEEVRDPVSMATAWGSCTGLTVLCLWYIAPFLGELGVEPPARPSRFGSIHSPPLTLRSPHTLLPLTHQKKVSVRINGWEQTRVPKVLLVSSLSGLVHAGIFVLRETLEGHQGKQMTQPMFTRCPFTR